MNATLRENIAWNGSISRGRFLVAGVTLFIVKYLVDALIANRLFDRRWTLWDYISSGTTFGTLLSMPSQQWMYAALVLVSLPFIAIGIQLTLNRLRDAGLSLWPVVFFFAPVVNLVFFTILSVLQSRRVPMAQNVEPVPAPDSPRESVILSYGKDDMPHTWKRIARFLPEGHRSAYWVAVLVPIPIVMLVLLLGVYWFEGYGLGVFVASPFVQGMVAALLFGGRHRRTLSQCSGAAASSYLLGLAAFIVFAFEGLGCLIMFLPLGLPLAMMGAALGYALQRSPASSGQIDRFICSSLVMVPLIMTGEKLASPPAPEFAVVSSVDIDAPPQTVWRHVTAFPPLDPPTEWIFRIGIAYPMRAEIDGTGPGAIRRCVFSTGDFVEPIEVWDEPRLLKFSVTSNPPAMREWTFYSNVHPPHIDNFLKSHAGQFRLIELPGQRTRLEGTTWYEHNLWPARYWGWWSDYLIHRIHLRVLQHVKVTSEQRQM